MFNNTEELKILSFKFDGPDSLIKLCGDGRYQVIDVNIEPYEKGQYPTERILESSYGNKIQSILYRNIVYTVNDVVYYTLSTDEFRILKFTIEEDTIKIKIENRSDGKYITIFPAFLSKEFPQAIIEQQEDILFEQERICFKTIPLLITEEGSNLYEGDECFIVKPDFTIECGTADCHTDGLVYSEKQNAENYILYNKNVFSLQDMLDLHEYNVGRHEKYIELAKNKVNGTEQIR